jgi:hypothetical protein
LIILSISPAFALGLGGRNLILINMMYLSPLAVIIYNGLYKGEIFLIVFMISILAFPWALHPETLRWSTILYTYMFSLTFLAYRRILNFSNFSIRQYHILIKYLIYAYFIVLLIQQFCVLTGLPVFNLSNYNPLYPWKLNSLSAEPSHSGRIVGLLMYCYIVIKEIQLKRKYSFQIDLITDRWVWIAFLWTMVTMGSGTAFLFISIVLLKFMRWQNVLGIAIIVVVIVFLLNIFDLTAFERTYKTFLATLTLNPERIMEADYSASFRIVPILVLIKKVGFTSINDWFGHGIDFVSTFLYKYLRLPDDSITGGGLFQLWMEYGLISFFSFVVFSIIHTYQKNDYLSIIFWFLLVFTYGVNVQMVWLCIILLFTNKYFKKKFQKL